MVKKIKRKILVVDDDLGTIRLVKKALLAQNYEVISAMQGKAAVAMVKEESPDLVLLDVMMTDMSGSEVAKALQEDSQAKNIPIIFITSTLNKKEDKDVREIEIGEKRYYAFAKPLHFPKLLSVMRKAFKVR